jgi:hypothetical protein
MDRTEGEMINLDEYKPGGVKSTEVTVIKEVQKIAPKKISYKPEIIDYDYYYVKLVGLVLSGASSGMGNIDKIPSVIQALYVQKPFHVIKTEPLLQFIGCHHDIWLINYHAIINDKIRKCDGNVILRWMGCSNINEAVNLSWEGKMPLKNGERNPSVVTLDIPQMRRVLGL